ARQLKLNSLSTINNLLSDFTDNFRTNLEPYQLKRLADMSQQINADNVYSFSLEPQDNLICSKLIDANTGQRIIAPPPAAAPTPTPTPTSVSKTPPTSSPTPVPTPTPTTPN